MYVKVSISRSRPDFNESEKRKERATKHRLLQFTGVAQRFSEAFLHSCRQIV